MTENWNLHFPEQLSEIRRATEAAGFRMASDELTGSLLRGLAASKPKGALLELGTGTGMGTSWLLSGMDASSTLDTVDNDHAVVAIARRYLGHDSRVRFHVADGATFLMDLRDRRFDLIFAETAGEQYRATPLAWRLALDLRSLADEPDYPRLCEELWNRALDADHPQRRDWVRLFQSVVLDERSGWPTRMLAEIKRADSPVRLRQLLDLLNFNGSLIAFRFPEITRAFLQRADEVGGANGAQRIQSALYAISGPASRRSTSGELDPEDDYLEDEALKSAERHRDDPLLGPFYRWVVEGEQKDRQWNRDDCTASMAQLEES